MIHQGVEHSDERVTINGKLNLDKLKSYDKVYHDIVTTTIKYTVIPRWVLELIPGMTWLIQAGKNTKIDAGEHELQVMERVHALARSSIDLQGRVDYKAIKDRILMSKPRCMQAVPSIFTFVTHNGGSVNDPFLLRDARDFIRSHCPGANSISAESWALLAVEKDSCRKTPRLRWALVEYLYLYGDTCKESDLKKLTASNCESARNHADKLMNCMRAHAIKVMGSIRGDVVKLMGQFEVNMVAAALNLKHQLHKDFDVLCHKFMLDFAELTDTSPDLTYKAAAEAKDMAFFQDKENKDVAESKTGGCGMSLASSLLACSN